MIDFTGWSNLSNDYLQVLYDAGAIEVDTYQESHTFSIVVRVRVANGQLLKVRLDKYLLQQYSGLGPHPWFKELVHAIKQSLKDYPAPPEDPYDPYHYGALYVPPKNPYKILKTKPAKPQTPVTSVLMNVIPGLVSPPMTRCPHSDCDQKADDIMWLVIHLNDQHRNTRNYIADWLESLDVDLSFTGPEEPEQIVEGTHVLW